VKPVAKPEAHVVARNQVAFDVPAKKSVPKGKAHAIAKHHAAVTKHSAGKTQSHSTQVVHP
jgi:hypothetical protein